MKEENWEYNRGASIVLVSEMPTENSHFFSPVAVHFTYWSNCLYLLNGQFFSRVNCKLDFVS